MSYIYLANDLIQRSKIKNQKPEFWSIFQPYLEEALTALLDVKSCKLDSQQKLDILKVIDVWKQRNVYPNEFVDPLYQKLLDQSGIDAGYLIKHKSKKIKTSHLRGLTEAMDKKQVVRGLTALDVSCP